jgi:hypothetical protein
MAFVLIWFAAGNPTEASAAPTARIPAPYRGVHWAELSYPGLTRCFVSPARVPSGGPLILEKVDIVTVSGRSEPLALVVVSCNINHAYANLYAFGPGAAGQPALLQRLSLYQGSEQLAELATSTNHVSMKVAGYTGNEGLCCPSVISIRRWRWTGSAFKALPATTVTQIVMPKLLGLSLGKASRVLEGLGVVFFDAEGTGQFTSVVAKQPPGPGTVLRPPSFTVSLTTK